MPNLGGHHFIEWLIASEWIIIWNITITLLAKLQQKLAKPATLLVTFNLHWPFYELFSMTKMSNDYSKSWPLNTALTSSIINTLIGLIYSVLGRDDVINKF